MNTYQSILLADIHEVLTMCQAAQQAHETIAECQHRAKIIFLNASLHSTMFRPQLFVFSCLFCFVLRNGFNMGTSPFAIFEQITFKLFTLLALFRNMVGMKITLLADA